MNINNNQLTGNINSKSKKKKNKEETKSKVQNKKIEEVKNIMKYNNDELNALKYDLALQYDRRTYWEYYISLLKSNHSFVFSFCNSYDYNARIIKMDLFLCWIYNLLYCKCFIF